MLNLSINHYNRKLAVPFKFERIERLERYGALTDSAPGPERILAAEEELNWVASLLAAISPRTCQIFLAQRGGYSYEEIAAAFAIKPRTVEKHVTTAAEALGEHSPFMPGPRIPSTCSVRIPLHSGAKGFNPRQGRGRP